MSLAFEIVESPTECDRSKIASFRARAHLVGQVRLIDVEVVLHASGPRPYAGETRRRAELLFVIAHARFDSARELAEAIAAWLVLPPSEDVPLSPISRAVVRVSGVDSRSCSSMNAIVSIGRGDLHVAIEEKAFGFVDVVYETKLSGIYRERIRPHTVLPTHIHAQMDENELVLGSGLLVQGRIAEPGVAYTWPKGHAHRWENVTDIEQSFLCIDRPAFIPTDEVEVAVPLDALTFFETTRYFS